MNVIPTGVVESGPAILAGPAGNALRMLGETLAEIGYTENAIAAMLGARSPDEMLSNTGYYAYFTDEATPGLDTTLGVLARLFLLNRGMPVRAARASLGPKLYANLESLGLLSTAFGECRGAVSVTPYCSRFFLSDQLFTSSGPQMVNHNKRPDLVMPPHATSICSLGEIANVAGSFLDVGCAGGFLSIMAESRCDWVAGLDINPRAVGYARANATMNGSAAVFEIADIGEYSIHTKEPFDNLLFNSPSMPRFRAEDSEIGQLSGRAAFTLIASAAQRTLRRGGTARIMLIAEVLAKFGSFAEMVDEWSTSAGVAKVTICELEAPNLRISPRDLRSRRLHGQSLLVTDRSDVGLLMEALIERGVVEVVPAILRISV